MRTRIISVAAMLLVPIWVYGQEQAPSGTAATASAQNAPEVIRGEKLDPSLYGADVVESMDVVLQREERLATGMVENPKARNGAQGEWIIPSRRSTFYPHSGDHYAMNKWGDTSMGIGFPTRADVDGAYFVGQGNHGAWASAVRAVGYRNGLVVNETSWLQGLGESAKWLDMGFKNVDRIVIEAKPAVEGAGWFGLDDLRYSPRKADGSLGKQVILDFEDTSYRQSLRASGYGGLTWEIGTGDFTRIDIVHPPQVPPGAEEQVVVDDGGSGGLRSGLGTLPILEASFATIRYGGGSGASSIPPDTCGAVGPNHFVSIVNANMSAYLKGGSHTRVLNVSLSSFLPGSSGDPRIVFDQHSGRWIVLVTDFNTRIFLAVSSTDDPTGSWFKTNITISAGSDAGRWPDFPTLGVSADGIFSSAYMVGGPGMSIFVIDKAPLIAGIPSLGTVTAFRNLNWEGAMQPVHMYGTAGGEYIVSTPGSPYVRVRKVTGPMTSPALTTLATINVGSYGSPPDAPALESSTNADTGDYRFWQTPVYQNGFIWAAHTVSYGGRSAARWYKINTSPLGLADSGTVADASLYFFYPHISVNQFDDVVMGMSGSNASQYIGSYYTGRRHDDAAGEMAVPVQYRAGAGSYTILDGYGRNRWGDYSATSLDPNDESTLWTIQEYAFSTNAWGTYTAKLSFGDCNGNGTPDADEIAANPLLDCQPDSILDECQLTNNDCNGNLLPDECDLVGNDCNADTVPDDCQLVGNDCDANLTPDDCDVVALETLIAGPIDAASCPGATAVLSVTTPGGLGYQWYGGGVPLADGGDISGVTTDTLTIQNVGPADEIDYYCKVNDGCIVGNGQAATLAIIPTSIAITQQPVAQIVVCAQSGQGAAFQMAVDDPLAVTYQWYKDGVPVVNDSRISGAQADRLEISPVQTSDLGFYACQAVNPCGGSVDTDPALGELVVADPVYSQQPQDTCVSVSGSTTFSVAVSPSNTLLYWYQDGAQVFNGTDANGMVISGVTTDTLQLSNMPASYDQSQFYVSGFNPNPLCQGDSTAATLTVGGCLPCCAASDVDCSGTTDAGDILVIRGGANWNLTPPANVRADVDGSGTADAGDILVVRGGAVWNVSTGPCDCACSP